jgi:hypothetical protein
VSKDDERKADNRRKIASWFDPNGNDFLGTGLSLRDSMNLNMLKRFRWWFGQHGRAEKKKRIHYIMELSAELKRIKDSGYNFATALAEDPIENIIEGDLASLKHWATGWGKEDPNMVFEGMPEDDPRQPWKVYERFQQLVEEASLCLTEEPDIGQREN